MQLARVMGRKRVTTANQETLKDLELKYELNFKKTW